MLIQLQTRRLTRMRTAMNPPPKKKGLQGTEKVKNELEMDSGELD